MRPALWRAAAAAAAAVDESDGVQIGDSTDPCPSAAVPGLEVLLDFVDGDEEAALLQAVQARPWESLRQRRVQHYGLRFFYGPNVVDIAQTPEPLPSFLRQVADRLMPLGAAVNQCTVNEYQPGQGIAPHVDTHSVFQEPIFSLSLAAPVQMDFRDAWKRRRITVTLPPRSLLVLRGDARYGWLHGIAPRKTDQISPGVVVPRERRVSLTFREVRSQRACSCAHPSMCDLTGAVP